MGYILRLRAAYYIRQGSTVSVARLPTIYVLAPFETAKAVSAVTRLTPDMSSIDMEIATLRKTTASVLTYLWTTTGTEIMIQ